MPAPKIALYRLIKINVLRNPLCVLISCHLPFSVCSGLEEGGNAAQHVV